MTEKDDPRITVAEWLDPRIAAAAEWLRSDDTAYETLDVAVRAAREMLSVADAIDPLRKQALNRDRHFELWNVVVKLPTDYTDYGGTVERWADEDAAYPDCSCGCRWAVPLEQPLGFDWVVCSKPNAPRSGLLTFEHQTGNVCFESSEDDHD